MLARAQIWWTVFTMCVAERLAYRGDFVLGPVDLQLDLRDTLPIFFLHLELLLSAYGVTRRQVQRARFQTFFKIARAQLEAADATGAAGAAAGPST